jgi:membrane protease YdiL (CAAX protease family)
MVEVVTALGLTFAVEAALLSAACVLVQRVYGLSFYEEMRISLDYKIGSPSLVVLGMALALSVVLVSAMVARFVPGLVPEQETPIEQLLTTPGSVVLFAIFGIAIAPALEELMFRGFLFRVLQDVVGMSIAVWTTAAIFALFHGPQLWPNWPAIIVILGVGYVLSKLRERTDSVIPGFIGHTVYNAVLFLLFAFASVTGANDLR